MRYTSCIILILINPHLFGNVFSLCKCVKDKAEAEKWALLRGLQNILISISSAKDKGWVGKQTVCENSRNIKVESLWIIWYLKVGLVCFFQNAGFFFTLWIKWLLAVELLQVLLSTCLKKTFHSNMKRLYMITECISLLKGRRLRMTWSSKDQLAKIFFLLTCHRDNGDTADRCHWV